MTTYNRSVNQATTTLSAEAFHNGRTPVTVEAVIDFSATGNTNLSADIFNVLNIPAGYAIIASGLEVLKADSAGNSGTVQLKLGSTNQGSAVAPSATGFLATVGTMTPVVPSGSSAFLNVVIGTGAINAIVRVFVTVLDQRYRPGGPVVTGTQTTPAGGTAVLAVDPVSSYTTALVYVL